MDEGWMKDGWMDAMSMLCLDINDIFAVITNSATIQGTVAD